MDWEDKKAVEAAIPKRDAKKGFGQYQTPPHLYRSLLKPEDRYMAVLWLVVEGDDTKSPERVS